MRLTILSFIIGAVIFSACKLKEQTTSETILTKAPLTKAQQIINDAIQAHGGKKYETAHYEFTFRKKQYSFRNQGAKFSYTKESQKDGVLTMDRLWESGFERLVDGKKAELTEKQVTGYGNSVNSVIYFATLPHKLNDAAVNKKYVGMTNVKGKAYEVVEVTFEKEGGGADHDDTYYYWINKESQRIDFLAYNYMVNNGGVRFRSAYNTRVVDGIVFQDYVNYKAEVGTPLGELPVLWEADKLKELSKIETENIKALASSK